MTRLETVGYGRLSLTGLLNPYLSVSSVVRQEIMRLAEPLLPPANPVGAERAAK